MYDGFSSDSGMDERPTQFSTFQDEMLFVPHLVLLTSRDIWLTIVDQGGPQTYFYLTDGYAPLFQALLEPYGTVRNFIVHARIIAVARFLWVTLVQLVALGVGIPVLQVLLVAFGSVALLVAAQAVNTIWWLHRYGHLLEETPG